MRGQPSAYVAARELVLAFSKSSAHADLWLEPIHKSEKRRLQKEAAAARKQNGLPPPKRGRRPHGVPSDGALSNNESSARNSVRPALEAAAAAPEMTKVKAQPNLLKHLKAPTLRCCRVYRLQWLQFMS